MPRGRYYPDTRTPADRRRAARRFVDLTALDALVERQRLEQLAEAREALRLKRKAERDRVKRRTIAMAKEKNRAYVLKTKGSLLLKQLAKARAVRWSSG